MTIPPSAACRNPLKLLAMDAYPASRLVLWCKDYGQEPRLCRVALSQSARRATPQPARVHPSHEVHLVRRGSPPSSRHSEFQQHALCRPASAHVQNVKTHSIHGEQHSVSNARPPSSLPDPGCPLEL